MNEQDFEKYLNAIRSKKPNAGDVLKWEMAVKRVLPANSSVVLKRPYLQMVAATFIGFFMGCIAMYSFNHNNTELNFAENNSENATIEYIVTKMN